MKSALSLTLGLVAIAALALLTANPRGDTAQGSFLAVEDQPGLVAAKQDHLREVIAVLKDRPRPDLDPAHAARRLDALDELARYAEAGVFIHNTDFPGDSTPYFRDRYDRLCALGHLIDASGERDMLEELIDTSNNAWISQLDGHAELEAWLDERGLTKAEVAYIQGPGFVTGPPGFGNRGGRTGGPPGEGQGGETGGTPRVGAPLNPRFTTRSAQAWSGWWSTAWRRFGGVRAGGIKQDAGPDYEQTESRRPPRATVADRIAPLLEKLAAGRDDVAATAVVALARAIGRDDPERAQKVAFSAHHRLGSAGRPYAVFALAWIPTQASRDRLVGILNDTSAGRRAVGLSRSIPESTRALAAFGLGVHGGELEADVLMKALTAGSKSQPDLRASIVTALGVAAERGIAVDRIGKRLLGLLGNRHFADQARAAIPGALLRTGSAEGRTALRELVRTFEGPLLVRRAAAKALGRYTTQDAAATEALEKAARRDPDVLARQQSIIALGELALGEALSNKERKRVSKFLMDGLSQRFKQGVDQPAFAIAAALLARRYENASPEALKELRNITTGSASEADREAASLSLGLLNVAPALQVAADVQKGTKSSPVLARAVEARGLYADASGMASWMQLLKRNRSDDVRRAAARSLARLQESSLLPFLLKQLRTTASNGTRAVLAEVLGEIGDRDLAEALIGLAGKSGVANPVRMRAVAALGRLSEPEDRTWFHGAVELMENSALTPSQSLLTSLF